MASLGVFHRNWFIAMQGVGQAPAHFLARAGGLVGLGGLVQTKCQMANGELYLETGCLAIVLIVRSIFASR